MEGLQGWDWPAVAEMACQRMALYGARTGGVAKGVLLPSLLLRRFQLKRGRVFHEYRILPEMEAFVQATGSLGELEAAFHAAAAAAATASGKKIGYGVRTHKRRTDTFRPSLAANGTSYFMSDQDSVEAAATMHDVAAVRWRRALIIMRCERREGGKEGGRATIRRRAV